VPLVGVPVTPGTGRVILTRTVTVGGASVDVQLVQLHLAGESGTDLVLLAGQQPMAGSVSVTFASDQPPIQVSGAIASITNPVVVDHIINPVSVTGTFWQATQPVSGTFWQATQPISVAALPLPANAAQETGGNLAGILAKLNASIAVVQQKPATGAWTEIVATAVATQVWAANANRLGGTIWNNSTGIAYVLMGSGITSSHFTVALAPISSGIGGYWELPFGYTGVVQIIWGAGATGSAYCEEF